MMSLRATCWAALLLLAGCETSATESAAEDAADAEPQDAGLSGDAEADSGRRATDEWCKREWGNVLAPAAEGALVLWSNPNVSPLQPGAWLKAKPDAVQARTSAGDVISCASDFGSYSCRAAGGFDEIVFGYGDHELTIGNDCLYEEDPRDVYLQRADCVPDGTVVVEGELLDYDPGRASPHVTLEGPIQSMVGSIGLGGQGDPHSIVGTPCRVEGGHYACTTVGFSRTETHAVVAGGVRSEVALPVADCAVERVQLDIRCPARPEGFHVAAPTGRMLKFITASYEGGEPYECQAAPSRRVGSSLARLTQPGREYLCPPAPGNEHGRGTYHVVAVGNGREYAADVSDVFDGCGGSSTTVNFAQ
jgi:hypothetical protein